MLTQEQKQAICEDYKDRSNKVSELAKKYGVCTATIARIAVEMEAEPRVAKLYGKRKRYSPTARICPKCHKAIEVKGARFCCFCGADIRNNKERLIERIERAMPNIMHLPINMRDDMQQLFIDTINELKE